MNSFNYNAEILKDMEDKNTEIYRSSPFSSSLGVHHLFVIENTSIAVFHYD